MSDEALAHLRDMSKPCARCGARAGISCRKLTAKHPETGLSFVFPCGTTEAEARQVFADAAELMRRQQTSRPADQQTSKERG